MICKLILIGLLVGASVALGSPVKGLREDQPTAVKGERQLSSPIEYQRRQQQQQQTQLVEQQRELSKTRLDDEQKRVELTRSEQRSEEQVQLQVEQKRDEFYGQQREEPPAVQQREEPPTVQQREEPPAVQQREEPPTQQQAEEFLSQQREEVAPAPAPAPAAAPAPPAKGQAHYEAKTQIREEAPAKEPAPIAQRSDEERKISKTSETVKYVEQQKLIAEEPKALAKGQAQPAQQQQQQQRESQFEQQQFTQQVDLGRDYDQRRVEEQQAPLVQQHLQQRELEEQHSSAAVKGLAAPIAETEPYAFDYSVEGSSRRESGDTKGVVRGQYTLSSPDGSRRIVDYIADRDGFRASVNTNEFGTESRAPANVNLRSSQPAAEDISLRLEGKTREFLNPAQAVKGSAQQLIEQAPAVPAKPDNWSVKGASYVERAAGPTTHLETVYVEEAPQLEVGRLSGGVKAEQAPAKEVSRLEAVELPAASRADGLKAAEQQRAEPAKSAELRKPKSIDLYSTSRVSATAHRERPIIQSPRNHIVHHHQHPHHVQPQHSVVSPTRHYVSQSQAAPVRGIYREVPVVRHHQPLHPVATSSRVVQHGQAPRSQAHSRLTPYSSVASDEDAPIGFEASSS